MFESITSKEQLDPILAASTTMPQLIFKHSTRCPVSYSAWDSVQSEVQALSKIAGLWMINVISHRSVSLDFADALGVTHQSPQAVVLYKGEVIWNGSHHEVTGKGLLERIQQTLA